MTTNPHIRAGSLPPTQLHRVDASLLSYTATDHSEGSGYAIYINHGGQVTSEKPEPPLPVQYAGPEPDDEDGPPEMLAFAIVLAAACVICGVFIAGVWS